MIDPGDIQRDHPAPSGMPATTGDLCVSPQRCVVVGQGPMGLIFTHLLGRMGARQVIAIDRVAWRLRWAKRFGATDVVDASQEDAVEAVKRLTDGRMGDFVVEAVGHGRQRGCRVRRKPGAVLPAADHQLHHQGRRRPRQAGDIPHLRVIRVADPHPHRQVRRVTEGPVIAEIVGGAGFNRDSMAGDDEFASGSKCGGAGTVVRHTPRCESQPWIMINKGLAGSPLAWTWRMFRSRTKRSSGLKLCSLTTGPEKSTIPLPAKRFSDNRERRAS